MAPVRGSGEPRVAHNLSAYSVMSDRGDSYTDCGKDHSNRGSLGEARGSRRTRLFRLESGSQRVQRDVDEEMEFHLAMREHKLI